MVARKKRLKRVSACSRGALIGGATLGLAASAMVGPVGAQESDSLRPKYFSALQGKKIVFLPVQMSMDFTKDWDRPKGQPNRGRQYKIFLDILRDFVAPAMVAVGSLSWPLGHIWLSLFSEKRSSVSK
jgi:hypothetical protein